MDNKYPIYIVSKGRWESRLTVKALEKMGVPYFIVVEEQEYSEYSKVIDPKNILILDKQYQIDYDTCDDLGNTKSKGPGAARNFCWEHSIKNGYKRHWVLDDNIEAFGRLNRNLYIMVSTGTIFRCAEDFVDRYENVAIAGFNYDFMAKAKTILPAFVANTRIYSCLLIDNSISYRWRGRYNEDTDLSLRVLKDGLCTIQFNAFLQQKATTQTVKGGNTKDFYEKEGTKAKSQMIEDLHPDVAKVVWRFNRWHHHVNYGQYKKSNKLRRKSDLLLKNVVYNYGMSVINLDEIGTRGYSNHANPAQNIKSCVGCNRRVDIDTCLIVDSLLEGSKHSNYCDHVYGRRGWRQLGVYDG